MYLSFCVSLYIKTDTNKYTFLKLFTDIVVNFIAVYDL